MVSSTLLAAALVAFLSAAAYATVAWQLRKRAPADLNDQWALRHFVVWWAAIAANIFAAGLLYVAAAFGPISLGLQITASLLQRVLLAFSLWGLLTYLLYLITGRRYAGWTAILYAAHAAFMVMVLFQSGPNGVIVAEWRTDLSYETRPPPVLDLVNFGLLVLAPVVASIAYLVIAIRLPGGHAEQRFRSIIVSTALIFWWVVAVLAGQRTLLDLEWLQLVNRALGLSAALAIVVAYHPPAILRRKWMRLDAAAPA